MQLYKLVLAFLICFPISLSAELSEVELYANVAYLGYESARLEKAVLENTQSFVSQLLLLQNITNDVYSPEWIEALYTNLSNLKKSLEERAKIVRIWQVCTQHLEEITPFTSIEELRIEGQQILLNESVALWSSISQIIKLQYDSIEQMQAELQYTQDVTKGHINESFHFDCDENLQPLAQMDFARMLGGDMLHHGLTLMQFGTNLTIQLGHVFGSAMHYFKAKYNALRIANLQNNVYLLFNEYGSISEENRTIILPLKLGE